MDLLLPSGIYDLIGQRLLSCPLLATPPCYRRLVMPLSGILEPDFFNAYIKTGNILLLSQGVIGIDNVFCLSDGILRMSLDKEAYEKAGLVGKPAKFGNGSGVMKRRRWLVELNLRAPNYLTGTKSFNRLQKACMNAFRKPLVFLFADIANSSVSEPSATPSTTSSLDLSPQEVIKSISSFPERNIVPQVHTTQDLIVPSFRPPQGSAMNGGGKGPIAEYDREIWRTWILEIYEFLGLVSLPGGAADRLHGKDRIDPLLSTYSMEDSKIDGVTVVVFTGLVSARFIQGLWKTVEELLESVREKGKEAWTALVVHGFENTPISWDGKEHGNLGGGENVYTVLRLPEDEGKERQLMLFELVSGQDEHS